ncbi:MAG: YIP1 family protein [Acidimicrobiia bacterium]|nr:YIP1 family protein [Acidimicrobiia bacterium]
MSRAIQLDGRFYQAVASQPALTREAVGVAVGSALIAGLGLTLLRIVTPLWWLIGSLAWATVALGLGTWFVVNVGGLLGGTARYDQMLRALGYAMAPQALGFVPIADFSLGFLAGGAWAATCSVIAVREVHGIPTGAAVALIVAPLLVLIGSAPLVVFVLQGA